MCTAITVTRRYVLCSRRMNKAGTKIDAHAVITMETSSAFLRSRGISKRTVFLRMELKDGLAKKTMLVG